MVGTQAPNSLLAKRRWSMGCGGATPAMVATTGDGRAVAAAATAVGTVIGVLRGVVTGVVLGATIDIAAAPAKAALANWAGVVG